MATKRAHGSEVDRSVDRGGASVFHHPERRLRLRLLVARPPRRRPSGRTAAAAAAAAAARTPPQSIVQPATQTVAGRIGGHPAGRVDRPPGALLASLALLHPSVNSHNQSNQLN